MTGRNVFTVLEETARQHSEAVALHQPLPGKGVKAYRTFTWNQWVQVSREIALGLVSLGLKKGEIVCVLSETRAEFYLVDLGIMGAAGVSAALYTAYPMPELAKNIQDAGPNFLFVEDTKTLAALTKAIQSRGNALPPHVILMTGEEPGAISLAALQERGRDMLQHDANAFSRLQPPPPPPGGPGAVE